MTKQQILGNRNDSKGFGQQCNFHTIPKQGHEHKQLIL